MRISKKRVFVSGCFDLLHSGHISFLETASKYGYLIVAVGSDRTIMDLKGAAPVTRESERVAMVRAIRWVDHAFISSGVGQLDFEADLALVSPDLFIVNEDGHSPEKKQLCERLGVEYRVLNRAVPEGAPPRSTSELRNISTMPYRLDLAGGWLDQPFVSELCAGPVITVSLEPSYEFALRSGMGTSTRDAAHALWGPRLPAGHLETLAKNLFCCENPPGDPYVSGSQDAIGLVYPGINRLDYAGKYWPETITSRCDEDSIRFVESCTTLVPLAPRHPVYHPEKNAALSQSKVQRLSEASDLCWQAINARNIVEYSKAVQESFAAQVSLFPDMITPEVQIALDGYSEALGYKLAGAGGGGYLVVVHKELPEESIQLRIRRSDY